VRSGTVVFGRQDGGFRGQAAAACRDSLRWLVNTHPWFRNLSNTNNYFQHTHGPFYIASSYLAITELCPTHVQFVSAWASSGSDTETPLLSQISTHGPRSNLIVGRFISRLLFCSRRPPPQISELLKHTKRERANEQN
jgi:hypothetical protein